MCHKCVSEKINNNSNPDIDLSLLNSFFKEYENNNEGLISMLQRSQDIYGYLPISVLEIISERTGAKKAKLYGIATFYSQFRLKPLGKYVILQCQGTACYVNGSKEVSKAICEILNISPGETTDDGMFTLEDVACLGCCSLAPVIMINGEIYGKLTPDLTKKIITDIYDKEKGEKAVEN